MMRQTSHPPLIMKFWTTTSLLFSLASFSTSQAAELSLVQGLVKHSSAKKGLSSTQLNIGARYAQQFHAHMYWFLGGSLGLHSFSSDGDYTPQDTTNLSVEGGVRYYFDRLSERLTPYGAVAGQLVTEKTAIKPGSYYIENERNGLYYQASIGLRLSLNQDFFLDLESPLFTSALFANETSKEIVVQEGGSRTVSTSEGSRYELFVDTSGVFRDLIVSVGMRF